MLRAMTDERSPSSLRGRLADVYVPTIVQGGDSGLDSLAKRLGNRATIDDPLHGRVSSLASVEPLLANLSAFFQKHAATYRHGMSTTGVDRDLSEGVLELEVGGTAREMPIVVVAERRRLREIELRIYYAPPGTPPNRPPRAALAIAPGPIALPQLPAHVADALKKGAVERVLAAFEEGARVVAPDGSSHPKRDGKMSRFISDLGAGVDLEVAGIADDGRTCGVEAILHLARREPAPAVLAFARGDTGLLRELRLYYE
jgi:hypothetical protein